jgi:hypothetical protein
MGNGSHIFDCPNFQTSGCQGTDGRFPSGSRSFDPDFNGFHSVFPCDIGGSHGSLLGGKGSPFPRTFESQGSGAGPTHQIALQVRNAYQCIVKCSLNMGDPGRDHPFFLLFENLFFPAFAWCFCHSSFTPQWPPARGSQFPSCKPKILSAARICSSKLSLPRALTPNGTGRWDWSRNL